MISATDAAIDVATDIAADTAIAPTASRHPYDHLLVREPRRARQVLIGLGLLAVVLLAGIAPKLTSKIEKPVHALAVKLMTMAPGKTSAGGSTGFKAVSNLMRHHAKSRSPLTAKAIAADSPPPLLSPPSELDATAAGDAPDAPSTEGSGSGVGAGLGTGQGNGNGGIGTGPASAPAALDDLSHRAEPHTRAWNCEWPLFTKVRDATVIVEAKVNVFGRAEDADVISTTDPAFSDNAADCAMKAHYHPGLGKDGKPGLASTGPLTIHFIKTGDKE